MKPIQRRLAGAIALTLTLAGTGPAQAKDLPSRPGQARQHRSSTPRDTNDSTGWAYAAIVAGGTGLVVIAASGAFATGRRGDKPHENRQQPTIPA